MYISSMPKGKKARKTKHNKTNQNPTHRLFSLYISSIRIHWNPFSYFVWNEISVCLHERKRIKAIRLRSRQEVVSINFEMKYLAFWHFWNIKIWFQVYVSVLKRWRQPDCIICTYRWINFAVRCPSSLKNSVRCIFKK